MSSTRLSHLACECAGATGNVSAAHNSMSSTPRRSTFLCFPFRALSDTWCGECGFRIQVSGTTGLSSVRICRLPSHCQPVILVRHHPSAFCLRIAPARTNKTSITTRPLWRIGEGGLHSRRRSSSSCIQHCSDSSFAHRLTRNSESSPSAFTGRRAASWSCRGERIRTTLNTRVVTSGASISIYHNNLSYYGPK